MRVCVIGNSHIGAIKKGWDANLAADPAAWADLQPTFFGAPRDGLRHIKLEDGCIVPQRKDIVEHFQRTSAGQSTIVLADYHAFFLVGLGVSVKRVLRFYRSHIWVGLNQNAAKTLVHPAFMQEFLIEGYRATRLVEVASLIRSAVPRPVLAMTEPLWAEWIREGQDGTASYGWDNAIKAGDAEGIAAAFRHTVTAALDGVATLVAQAPETVRDSIMTAAAFNDGGPGPKPEDAEIDAAHMNAAFGQAMWHQLRQALNAAEKRGES